MKFRVLLPGLLLVSQLAFAQVKQTSEQLYREAYENFIKRDYASAAASLDKIDPAEQKKADILNLRGAIHKRLGELDSAANAYGEALKINPKDWVPKYNLAEVNFLRQQYKSSRSYLEQALDSMPEADRLQQRDIILYKVYLTYLLQDDEENARQLLDGFDKNSLNPVYYFAQAAWSYKKKEAAEALVWVESSEGLYSPDLRNSYGQALVDIGWLDPSAGIGTDLAAPSMTPSASPSPTQITTPQATAASPAPATGNAAPIVPLATNNATPITVVPPTATPATPATTTLPALTASTEKKKTGEGASFPLKTGIFVVGLLGLVFVFIWLINLAKRSRIVPPPEDNTGYDAIAASANPGTVGAIAHSSEGTGVVLEQDARGGLAPGAIKATSIRSTPLPKKGVKTKPQTPGSPKKTPATKGGAKKIAAAKTAANKRAPKTSGAKSAITSRRTRLIPIPTINVPPPEVPPPKLLVSDIETLKVDPTKKAAPSRKPAAKATAPAEVAPDIDPVPQAPAPIAAAPLIAIPEFADSQPEFAADPATRLVTETAQTENPPENS